MSSGVDISPENFFSLFLNCLFLSHLGSKLLDFNDNLLNIDSGYQKYISVVFLQFDNLSQIIFIHSFLNSNVRILPECRLLYFFDNEKIGVIFVLKFDDSFDVDVNEAFKSLANDFLVFGLDKDFSRVLFFHGHCRCDVDFEFFIFSFSVMLSFFENGKYDFILFSHFTLNRVSLVIFG
jgi:hypothetical protein